MMKYEPKPVPGYEDNYYLDPETMTVVNRKTGRSLKPRATRDGYMEVQLWKNNKGKHKDLHRLFAEVYIPNPDNLPEVNHRDETRDNFSLDNLEWCTHSYNMNYGTINGRRGCSISKAKRGKPQPWVAEQKGVPVIAIDKEGVESYYPSAREAGRQLLINHSGITGVLNNRYKTSGGYKFRYADR